MPLTPAVLEPFLITLAPLFLAASKNDEPAARQTGTSMLAAYHPADEAQLYLATKIICFSVIALEALGKSMDPDLSLNQVLRLRGSANAAQRSAHQCERTLEKLRKEPQSQPAPQPQPAAPPTTPEPLTITNLTQVLPAMLGPDSGLSRQQRRAVQRQLDKIKRREEENARLQARRAALDAARATAAATSG